VNLIGRVLDRAGVIAILPGGICPLDLPIPMRQRNLPS
jgi:hypothetical protein